MKALHFADGARDVIGHSVVRLVDRLGPRHDALRALRDRAAELDICYIPARYPNGLAEGTPHRVFTRSQAARALTPADSILQAVQREVGQRCVAVLLGRVVRSVDVVAAVHAPDSPKYS